MKIALLQLEVLGKNKEANVAHGQQLAAEAAKKHDLLVLPEVWTNRLQPGTPGAGSRNAGFSCAGAACGDCTQ